MIAKMEMPTEAPVSVADIIGFPKPLVVMEDVPLVKVVKLCTSPAAPPPAMIARVHLKSGSSSTMVDAMTIVPAITAVGAAIVSKILSINGIKYAAISNRVATLKIIKAGNVPIHSKPEESER